MWISCKITLLAYSTYIYKDDLTLDMEVVEDKGGVDEGIDRIELYF